jgi:hypothetical protein
LVEYYEWPASRVRSGRQFAPVAEAELWPTLRALALRLPSTDGTVHVVPEFSAANGIADLVALVSAEQGIRDRFSSGAGYLQSVSEASVASVFPTRRKVRADRAIGRLDMSERQARAIVAKLVLRGVLHRQGSYFIRDPAVVAVGRMYALEAKVADWRRGMTQSLRYSTWSDAAAVVLAKNPHDVERARERAKSFGIGMAVGSKWVVRPRLRRGSPGLRLLSSEIFLASIAGGSYHNPSADA